VGQRARGRVATAGPVVLPGRFRYFQDCIHARIWVEDGITLCVEPTFPSKLFVRRGYRLTPAEVAEVGRSLGFIHIWLPGKKRPMSIWAWRPSVIEPWLERVEKSK
jgi:hypothetical protein